jgi:hypothetical protein
MSKTDKTNPYWIHVRYPPASVVIVARHQCGNGVECDLDAPLPCTRNGKGRRIVMPRCQLWPKRYRCDKIFGRHPKRSTRKAMGRDRALRHDLVRLRRKWLWQDREDIDSLENAPINHRYLYDPWDWD